MVELIATITLIGSFIGLATIVIRKLPALAQLPLRLEKSSGLSFWQRVKGKVELPSRLQSFSSEKLLHKGLSKIRILALRTETRAEKRLQRLREKSKSQKRAGNSKYWQKLKETKNSSNISKNKPG